MAESEWPVENGVEVAHVISDDGAVRHDDAVRRRRCEQAGDALVVGLVVAAGALHGDANGQRRDSDRGGDLDLPAALRDRDADSDRGERDQLRQIARREHVRSDPVRDGVEHKRASGREPDDPRRFAEGPYGNSRDQEELEPAEARRVPGPVFAEGEADDGVAQRCGGRAG
jgi:hypothetical protein